jgi:catechol 2,3-dioxygenase-like lactoylglutathione lyase family enzyme
MTSSAPITPAPQPAFVGIVVTDMAASVAFYRTLGLDVPDGAESEPHVNIPFGPLILALDTEATIRSFDPDFTPPTGDGRVGVAFDCGSPAAVDAWFTQLTDAGYRGHRTPFDAFWGQRYATVLDPDGVGVDLFAWLP